jgi:hypothetical protein
VRAWHFASRVQKCNLQKCSAWSALLLLLLLVASLSSCSRPSPVAAAAPPAAPLYHGEITDYVPAAGLRWLVVGSPRQLARQRALAPLRRHWVESGRLAAYATATGIDLLRTERALAAGFDTGTLYIADASGWVAAPERLFTERLAGSERSRQAHPHLWQVSGVVGSEPHALVRVDDELVAVAVDDLALARAVELRALGRLQRVPRAFEGASLSRLPSEARSPRELSVYLLGPLDAEWAGDGNGLLAGAEALALTLSLVETKLDVELVLAGRWQSGDAQRFDDVWRAFAASSLGRRLGVDRPLSTPDARGSETLLTLRTRLDAGSFVSGFTDLMLGNLSDLLDESTARAAPATAP